VKFRCMSIIINYVYIHCHFLSWLLLPSSFVIFCFSSNVLLFLVHDTSLFQILFYYRGNEMKNLGYHFCQIFQNVMFVLKPIVSFTSINPCIFTIVVFSPNVIFKDSKHIILLIQKCILVEKHFHHTKYISSCIIVSKFLVHRELRTNHSLSRGST
jgi:hypothetical protein